MIAKSRASNTMAATTRFCVTGSRLLTLTTTRRYIPVVARQIGCSAYPVTASSRRAREHAKECCFKVEFVNDDGSAFTREPSVSHFEYTVKKVGGKFLVQDLPVCVPWSQCPSELLLSPIAHRLS